MWPSALLWPPLLIPALVTGVACRDTLVSGWEAGRPEGAGGCQAWIAVLADVPPVTSILRGLARSATGITKRSTPLS